MASGPLEEARALHEDMERLERLVVADYRAQDATASAASAPPPPPPASHLARLAQAHRVRRRLDAIQEGARKLLRLYEDADGARREEVAALAGGSAAQRERLAQLQLQQLAYPPPPPPPPPTAPPPTAPPQEEEEAEQNGGGDAAAAAAASEEQAPPEEQQPQEQPQPKQEEEQAGGEPPAPGDEGAAAAAAAAGAAAAAAAAPGEEQQQQPDEPAAAGVKQEEEEEEAAAAAAAADEANGGPDAPPPPPPPEPRAYPPPPPGLPPPPRPMPAASAPTPALAAFYARLAELQGYHARFPSRDVTRDEAEAEAAAVREVPDVPFSGEEARGRCVDLHALHGELLSAAAGWAEADAAKTEAAAAAAAAAAGGEGASSAPAAAPPLAPPSSLPPPPPPPLDYPAFLDALREWASGGPDGFPAGGARVAALRLPRARRVGGAWRGWCARLEAYLRSFHARTRPLVPAGARLERVERELREAWAEGRMPVGWGEGGGGVAAAAAAAAGGLAKKQPPPATAAATATATTTTIDLDAYESPQQLADAVGPDALKAELAARGLKVGGTPLQRAERLWQAATGNGAADTAQKKKKKKKGGGGGGPSASRHDQRALDAALGEARVRWLLSSLAPELQAARARAERRAALTAAELAAEAEEQAAADAAELRALAAGDMDAAAAAAATAGAGLGQMGGAFGEYDDDEDGHGRGGGGGGANPLRLPLGWDGRPIPYWLYKLHGLGHEFTCEICGGHSYWGRREYERHFREARHASGMRALGLPNTREFLEVTRVDDALALGRELEARRRQGGGGGGGGVGGSGGGGGAGGGGAGGGGAFEEELEDAQGNVFDRRTYELLARQGLV